ncbi:MAG: 4-hydroxy-3-methylbut-2-enyl diphosphate reductase [Spirochaetales bacterium]|nr:4-hydroxy-3-methylbut-2-enyl diphosphate reductase [Spirochaetales bacterium]MCF7938118.1 4-hydroxy-3-methylbut-2-enyl diphosphate reductase [Spirochaetales bacterium]
MNTSEEKRRVFRAEVLGFCMGVRRAVEIVDELLERDNAGTIWTLGPLIHNKPYLDSLAERGVRAARDPSEIDEGTVVIRAHGVAPSVRRKLQEKGLKIVDATCPKVLHSQQVVRRYSAKGYTIVIAGDKNHAEIEGLKGFADSYHLVETPEEAAGLDLPETSLLIGQTTFNPELYSAIADVLKESQPRVLIEDSMCNATGDRRRAIKQLVEKVDAVVVVGGKNSANTHRLYLAAKETGKPAWHIEKPAELPDSVFEFKRIGLAAGASTPDWSIDRVEEYLGKEGKYYERHRS